MDNVYEYFTGDIEFYHTPRHGMPGYQIVWTGWYFADRSDIGGSRADIGGSRADTA